jgi:hypothetical protein
MSQLPACLTTVISYVICNAPAAAPAAVDFAAVDVADRSCQLTVTEICRVEPPAGT